MKSFPKKCPIKAARRRSITLNTCGAFWRISRSEERRVGKECDTRRCRNQAEDGIRDRTVTGVQTCALPIWRIHDPLDHGKQNLDHELHRNVFAHHSRALTLDEKLSEEMPDQSGPTAFDNLEHVRRFLAHIEIGRASCRERV